jgi:hypothetical protein
MNAPPAIVAATRAALYVACLVAGMPPVSAAATVPAKAQACVHANASEEQRQRPSASGERGPAEALP